MKVTYAVLSALVLAGCGNPALAPKSDPAVQAKPSAEGQTRPKARPSDLPITQRAPPPAARTAEQFDTTTPEERAKAAATPEPAGEKKLGDTVASLGDPSKPGFWLETPLVSSAQKGRVFFPASGKSAQVDLIPIDGPDTAGSRISLAAMRLIEAPLTDLPTIQVFSGG